MEDYNGTRSRPRDISLSYQNTHIQLFPKILETFSKNILPSFFYLWPGYMEHPVCRDTFIRSKAAETWKSRSVFPFPFNHRFIIRQMKFKCVWQEVDRRICEPVSQIRMSCATLNFVGLGNLVRPSSRLGVSRIVFQIQKNWVLFLSTGIF